MTWYHLPSSCHCSQEWEGLISGSDSPTPTPAPSVTSSETSMPLPFSSRELKTKPYLTRLSGLTLPPSMAGRGVAQWIRSLAASRAKISLTPGSVKASPATAPPSGQSTPDSSTKSDQLGFLLKTSHRWLREVLAGCFKTLPTSGTMRSGIPSARKKSARPNAATDSFSSPWPTPTVYGNHNRADTPARAGDGLSTKAKRMTGIQWPTPTATPYGYNQKTQDNYTEEPRPSLRSLASQWPTPMASKASSGPNDFGSKGDPTLSALALQWGTPTSRDHKDGAGAAHQIETNGLLGRQAPRWTLLSFPPLPTTSTDGHSCGPSCQVLNPLFVEWLQNLPWGWTDLSPLAPNVFAAWETASSRCKLLLLGLP